MIGINIEKTLGDFHLNVDIETSSQVLGILGESGSGKTMILKCISGLLDPDSGYIKGPREYYNSEKEFSMKAEDRNIGYLLQSYGLFPNMSAIDNIKFVARNDNKNDQALKALERVGLLKQKDLFPKDLSGGQKQRLAMARMLSINPEMILLDEPFSALDSVLRSDMEDFMKEIISDLGVPTIFVSHNRREVYRFCNDIMIIDKGRLEDFGPKERVFFEPRTCQAARMVGFENIISGSNAASYIMEDLAYKDLESRHIAVKNTDIRLIEGKGHRISEKIEEIGNFRYSVENLNSSEIIQVYTSEDHKIGEEISVKFEKFHII